MVGFLCALGIAGGTAFATGWNSSSDDPLGMLLVISGGALLIAAAGSGLIRILV